MLEMPLLNLVITHSLPKVNLTEPRKLLNRPRKSQMKALHEYFLMVVFMLLLNRAHIFESSHFMFNLFEQRNMAIKG